MAALLTVLFVLQPPDAERVAELLKQATPSNKKAVRLKAIVGLQKEGWRDPKATYFPLAAYAADSDKQIRIAALKSLGTIAHGRVACPIPLVKALLDQDRDIRETGLTYFGAYSKFPKAAGPVLFHAAKSKDSRVREAALVALPNASGKTKQVIELISAARKDGDEFVRSTARYQHYRVTGELKPFVRHLLFLTRDRKNSPAPKTQDEKVRLARRNLLQIGAAMKLYELTRTKPKELAQELVANLANADALLQEAAIRQLRALCVASRKSHRAVLKTKPQAALANIKPRLKGQTGSTVAEILKLLKEGPPANTPDDLKPLGQLAPQ